MRPLLHVTCSPASLVVGTVAVVAATIGYLYRHWRSTLLPTAKVPIPEVNQQSLRPFTAEELNEFDGERSAEIYISVKGTVFSVTAQLYGPGAPYHCFAGTECSRCLAKSILGSTKELNADWATLSRAHIDVLDGWLETFTKKYPIAGWFVADTAYLAKGAVLEP